MATKDTKIKYRKRAIQLMSKAYKEASNIKHKYINRSYQVKLNEKVYTCLHLLDTAKWAYHNWSQNLRKDCWRQYRASFIFYGEVLFKSKKISEKELNQIKEILRKTSGGDNKLLPSQTSSSKKKSISDDDLKELDLALAQSKNKWSNATRLWLRSGILTGLRPIEWSTAELIYYNGDTILKVKNAKATNGRSFGEYRHLNLSHMNEKEIEMITQNLNTAKKFYKNNMWDQYYQGCSNILRYTFNKKFKSRRKRISLYSTRHQFSANMKASNCTKQEVAALMGHANDETAQSHYGKKRVGKNIVKPKISKKEIKKVVVKTNKSNFTFDK